MLSSGMGRCRRRTVGAVGGVIVLVLLVGMVADIVRKPDVADAAGGPPTRIITYEVHGWDNASNLEQFAATAAETYADPRGWSFGGSVAFVRVPSGGSFTLWLSAAAHLPSFGAPCDSSYSCTQGRNVIINETRWLNGSPAWNASGASLADYHHMVLNHETGHWIGFGHQLCGGPGQLAPVMQQQSISLQGCAPNPWPLDSERRAAAARLGVEIRLGIPEGSVDALAPWWHGVRVKGWAIDPDTAAPDVVQITVDGAQSQHLATLPRPDVAAAFPGYGPSHGFDVVVPASTGSHSVCAFAMNVAGGGSNALLGCQSVVVGSPFGIVEAVEVGPRLVKVSGWVVDPDTSASTSVHVYIDGAAVVVPATGSRPDVAAAFAGAGAQHGFEGLVAAAAGAHRLCVYGINIAGAGGNSTLRCQTIVVGGSPFGSLDQVVAGPNRVEVSGWAIDRDVATPDTVHVYVDGRATATAAARVRPDVGRGVPALRHRPRLRRGGARRARRPRRVCLRDQRRGTGREQHARLPARVRRRVTVRFARLGPHQPGHRLGDGMGHRPRHRGDRPGAHLHRRCRNRDRRRRRAAPTSVERSRCTATPTGSAHPSPPRPGCTASARTASTSPAPARTRPWAATTSASPRNPPRPSLTHQSTPSPPAGNPPSTTSTTRMSRGSR